MTAWQVAYAVAALASGVVISGWLFSWISKKYPDDDVDERAESLAIVLAMGVIWGALWPVFLPFTMIMTRMGAYGWFKYHWRMEE